jgi:polysaccharide export outer membrane protein
MGLRSHTRVARFVRGAALGLAWLGLGCATTPAPEPVVELEPYRVGAPDRLVVTILPEPLVREDVIVRPDGKITLQLLGDVRAAGRTPPEIAADIEEQISRYKRGARVSVALSDAQSNAVTVLGEVRSPRSFPLAKLTRVTEALGRVGGPTWLANTRGIRVVRPTPTGAEVLPVSFAAIRNGDLSTNLALEDGDIIYVPPTLLARIGYAIRSVLFPFEPLLGVANSAAGSAITP